MAERDTVLWIRQNRSRTLLWRDHLQAGIRSVSQVVPIPPIAPFSSNGLQRSCE